MKEDTIKKTVSDLVNLPIVKEAITFVKNSLKPKSDDELKDWLEKKKKEKAKEGEKDADQGGC
jgi:DNA-directed RNA polymerase subunit F